MFAILLVLAPAAMALGRPFLPSADKVQLLLLVLGYFALSLIIIPTAARSPYTFLFSLIAFAAAGFAGAYLALRFFGLPASPWILGLGGAAAAICALIPYLSRRIRIPAVAALTLAAAVPIAAQSFRTGPAATERQVVSTALHSVNVDVYTGLIDSPTADGGALDAHRLGVILAVGDGKFYWLSNSPSGFGARKLAIPDPMLREAYLKNFADPSTAPRLRVIDVMFDRTPDPKQLFLAHQWWNRAGRCYTMRVSALPLAWAQGLPRAAGKWRTVFESRPCITAAAPFDDSEPGGRLAWATDGRLLLTLGQFGFNGLNGVEGFSQLATVDYGKILKIEPDTGRTSVVSIGHRNPQGLVVSGGGVIWSAEHGPQGGDEINLIAEGGNYGWPNATYGTNYGSFQWALNPDGHDHGQYREPAVAFVPSVALSPIIEVSGREFPHWDRDLLAGSLRTEALFRVRLSGDRVIYVESFSLGHRVRDLVQLADGPIMVWSDDGTIMVLSRDNQVDVFAQSCAACHEPRFGHATGPALGGVVGRRIASVSEYEYSAGLKKRRGVWTEAKLDAFLRDPNAYAPGTTMKLYGLDDKSRAQVIEQLVKKTR